MLEHLLKRVIETVGQSETATLSTCGPFGLQAGQFPCQFWSQAQGQMRMYLLVPQTLDILENLVANPDALATAALWQVRGQARLINPKQAPPDLGLFRHPHYRWACLVELCPRKIQLQPYAGWEDEATLDFDDEPADPVDW